ncbi:conserved hypothetical protein [Leptospira interrogans serovar Manilae]|uniref:DUF736 domain-containing protein n=1 Tax=Leptospira interrogans serovar Manilae TaxID=214675 RepID=A0AAQ1P421_LEPIR|nr:DUF736 family protein [Leptospira interrogans]AKP25941.1 hypothetical protein LIMLP_08295 [Leptospira interrogans serovar Manilae]AKP29726.1 hypothetical protein LIMHP_08290 [Leptospira interrogans serovar Manilae]EYU62488.1 hypothetical protein CI00_20100 [Leptospira interrogans serovar Manilae]SOR63396.1 conserved hypothetical protein [Leptospira interrogans serovar Manilae]
MSRRIGFMEEKSKGGKDFFNMEIAIPFVLKGEFFVEPNVRKNAPDSNSDSPDFLVYYAKNQVGAVWKRISKKNSTEYLSCEIFAPTFAEGKLNFRAFKDKETEGKYNLILTEQNSEVPS